MKFMVTEFLPHVGISVSSVLAAGVFIWNKINKQAEQIAELKKDIYYHQEIYERERKSHSGDISLIFEKMKNLGLNLSDIKADMKVIKFKLGINGHANKE